MAWTVTRTSSRNHTIPYPGQISFLTFERAIPIPGGVSILHQSGCIIGIRSVTYTCLAVFPYNTYSGSSPCSNTAPEPSELHKNVRLGGYGTCAHVSSLLKHRGPVNMAVSKLSHQDLHLFDHSEAHVPVKSSTKTPVFTRNTSPFIHKRDRVERKGTNKALLLLYMYLS